MICLRCGYCCREIWPGNTNDSGQKSPCPHLSQVRHGVAVCDIYPTRPKQCRDEKMGAREGEPCQIGLLALTNNEIPGPIGKCHNCGKIYWSTEYSPLCSSKCEDEAVDYLTRT
jgi:hypothetical protein